MSIFSQITSLVLLIRTYASRLYININLAPRYHMSVHVRTTNFYWMFKIKRSKLLEPKMHCQKIYQIAPLILYHDYSPNHTFRAFFLYSTTCTTHIRNFLRLCQILFSKAASFCKSRKFLKFLTLFPKKSYQKPHSDM